MLQIAKKISFMPATSSFWKSKNKWEQSFDLLLYFQDLPEIKNNFYFIMWVMTKNTLSFPILVYY